MNASFGQQLRAHREALGWTRKRLAHYAHCADVTVEKLERDERRPSLDLARQLSEALALTPPQQAQLLAAARPAAQAISSLPAAAENAPPPADPLVAREAELAQIHMRLTNGSTRLLTLTGTGGVGKTRLAQATLQALTGHFADGAVTVELAALHQAELILSATAHRLGVQLPKGTSLDEALKAHLRPRQLLLCFDNFEHLLAGAAQLPPLLDACPGLTLLVTSREALGLVEETVQRVEPLALTPTHADGHLSPAMKLFVQQARTANPAFRLTDENQAAVDQLCALVDGLPLAIELVAARSQLMSPQTMLARFASATGTPRLGLLTQERSQPRRHRTLRETLDWSYRLLDPAEQRAFLPLFTVGK